MDPWKLKALFIAWGVILLALTGCQKAVEPIRIGVNPWPGYESLVLAAERGEIAAEGVDVEILEYTSLSDVRIAFEQGWIDGMASTLVEVIQVRELTSRRPQIIAVADYSNGGDMILSSPEIESMSDLVGRRVGLEPGTLSSFFLARAMALHGLHFSQVEMRAMYQIEMEEALRTHQVDAVITYPPVSTEMGRQDYHMLFTSAEIPNEIIDVFSVDASLIEERPEAVAAILRAWDRTLSWIEENPEEAFAKMAARERASVEDFRAVYDLLVVYSLSEQPPLFKPDGPLERAIELVQEVLGEMDILTCFLAPEELLTTKPLEMALEAEGWSEGEGIER